MQGKQPRDEALFDAYLTAQQTATRRTVAERGRLLRGGYSRARPHLRVLRRQLDDALFAPPLPAPDAPASFPADEEELAYFFHDVRNNLQAAILAAAALERDLSPERRERSLHALRRALTNLTEDVDILDAVESYSQLPARPALALVPLRTAAESEN